MRSRSQSWRARSSLAAKTVETHGVAGADEVALVGGPPVGRGPHRRPRIGVVAVAVGIVARPEDALHADAIAVVDAVAVGHVREVGVALDVLARQAGQVVAEPVAQEAVVDLLL